MRNCNTKSIVALLSAVLLMAAVAEASGQPWPEAHSGAYLGVQVKEVTSETASALKLQAPAGAVIAYVDQDGPACHAGLMENDVVIAFDGAKVDGPQQLQNMIHVTAPQKTVTLTILRSGQRKDVKVTLGSWNVMSHVRAFNAASNLASPPPPRAYPPDIEMPSFTLLSARHGLVVESLSPQLSDFFGVTRGRGVLVRSVENGSPAAFAGLKAGDVILKINTEDVHDMSDWQRGMRTPGPKLSILIWRDRKEFIVVINTPGENSRLMPGDMLNFETDAQLFREQMEQLRPELAIAQSDLIAQLDPNDLQFSDPELSDKDMQQMRREIEKSMKAEQKEMKKMSKDLAKSAKPAQKDMEKMRQQIQASMPSQKDFDEMRQQLAQSMPTQKEMDDMKQQIQASMPSEEEFEKMKQQMPSQKDVDEMRRQIESSMKSFTPQMQQEMEQLKKQMEQQKLDLQQMMQDFKSQEF